MAQTLLSEKKSTAGSPYMFYTVEVTPSNRTATGVTISLTVKCHLQYSESTSGTGITYTAGLYVGGSWRELQLKSSSDSWSGTTVHTKSTSFTVSGLSVTTTALTSIKFRVTKTYGGSSVTTGGYLAETSVSNITIPAWTSYTISYNANGGSDAPSAQTKYKGVDLTLRSDEPTKEGYNFLGWATSSTATSPAYYPGGLFTTDATTTLYAVWELANDKSTITLSKNNAVLGETIRVNLEVLVSTNTHKIVWTSGSNSYTSHTSATSSVDVVLSESIFSSWFGSADKDISVNVTVTTYDSSGTPLGSETAAFTLKLTEEIAKPSTPIATVVRNAEGGVITLVKPTFKYGATFGEWEVTTNEGIINVSDDTVTASIDVNKTVVVSIRAVDSRGLKSDVVNIVCHIRKRGVCVYEDGIWKHMKVRHYNGAWVKSKPYVCDGEWKK